MSRHHQYPRRRVVESGRPFDVLECGHRYLRRIGAKDNPATRHCFACYLDDHPETWRCAAMTNGEGFAECGQINPTGATTCGVCGERRSA